MTFVDSFMTRLFRSERPIPSRRAYPISAYVGPNGGGKTAAMVLDTIPTLRAGRPVLSTVRLLDFDNPRPCDDPTCTAEDHDRHMAAHPMYVPLTDWKQLEDARFCDILMDEVTGVASSRESSSMPGSIANLLVQLRRRDVVLRWTAPAWTRADKIIRECTQSVTLCQGYLGVYDKDTDRQWRRRRFFVWRTYDAAAFEEWSLSKRDQLRADIVHRYWGPGADVFSAYDTDDAVSVIGHVLDTGRCAACGGKRNLPPCSCADYKSQLAASRAPKNHVHA